MSVLSRRLRIAVLVALLGFFGGCSTNTAFMYRPAPPAAGVSPLPARVAVLPFADGTEDFTKKGSVLGPDDLYYNLAKAGWGGVLDAMTPALWSKSLAAELAASGRFAGARFVYGADEVAPGEVRVEGTVEKATLSGSFGQPNDFALSLRAFRGGAGAPSWEGRVSRRWVNERTLYDGCGALALQCMVDRHKENAAGVMREMFAEAAAGLAAALAGGPSGASPPAGAAPLVGIGLEVGAGTGGVAVVRTLAGAPAARGGILAGDTIVSVDGSPVAGLPVEEVVRRLRGVAGTAVTVGVRRPGEGAPRNFPLVRELLPAQGGGGAAPPAEPVDAEIERILKGD